MTYMKRLELVKTNSIKICDILGVDVKIANDLVNAVEEIEGRAESIAWIWEHAPDEKTALTAVFMFGFEEGRKTTTSTILDYLEKALEKLTGGE
jgi:hypothetical protein